MSSNYDFNNYSSGGGGAGEDITTTATSGGGGGHSADYDYAEIGPADVAKDVTILFLSGVAILVGLVTFVYVVAMICDRFCCWRGSISALMTDGPRYVVGGEVARDAGLTGMTVQERRAVLEKVLVGKPYMDHKRAMCNSKNSGSRLESSNGGSVSPREEAKKPEGGEESSNQIDPSLSDVPTTDESDVGADDVEQRDVMKGVDDSENTKQVDDDGGGAPRVFENDSTVSCAICINEYEEHDEVLVGNSCSHMFHRECVLEWLERHDGCPCCRENMVTPTQMRDAAPAVLGQERTLSLALGYYCLQSSLDAGERSVPSPRDIELGNVDDVDGFENDGTVLTISREEA